MSTVKDPGEQRRQFQVPTLILNLCILALEWKDVQNLVRYNRRGSALSAVCAKQSNA